MKAIILANLLFLTAVANAQDKAPASVADGPFKPSWESLARYQCPDWFRDAKFGIWAHSPECQAEMGTWYARNIYIQGTPDNQFHCAHYGPPSTFGFKDVCNEWKAEHFDPDKLIALYKQAGAQYFVMMANFHDNMDNWDSKYQPWNSVRVGPKKDLVGLWERAARKAGLRFGVTVHAARAWEWYEVSQLSDTSGPLAGVPYDGNLTKADGKGKWWEGLDPQDLYAQNHKTGSDPRDYKSPSYIRGDPPSPAYCDKFYNRVIDLVDSYKPDLLYFDDSVLPLARVSHTYGLRIAAHFYNTSARLHQGRTEGVLTIKKLDEAQRHCLTWDIERGVATRIEPLPWQTDTCIGSWIYKRSIFQNHSYKTAQQVIQMLVDIVSKNGNLQLSIPVRGDGTINDDEVNLLHHLTAWMAVNRECIFGTRPWKIFGEGPSATETPEENRLGGAVDVRKTPYSPGDLRFTTKNGALYAIALAWPTDGKLTLRTLATGAPGIKGDVKDVELLGCKDKLSFKLTPAGLVVSLPAAKPCEHAFALKISGLDLAACDPVMPSE